MQPKTAPSAASTPAPTPSAIVPATVTPTGTAGRPAPTRAAVLAAFQAASPAPTAAAAVALPAPAPPPPLSLAPVSTPVSHVSPAPLSRLRTGEATGAPEQRSTPRQAQEPPDLDALADYVLERLRGELRDGRERLGFLLDDTR